MPPGAGDHACGSLLPGSPVEGGGPIVSISITASERERGTGGLGAEECRDEPGRGDGQFGDVRSNRNVSQSIQFRRPGVGFLAEARGFHRGAVGMVIAIISERTDVRPRSLINDNARRRSSPRRVLTARSRRREQFCSSSSLEKSGADGGHDQVLQGVEDAEDGALGTGRLCGRPTGGDARSMSMSGMVASMIGSTFSGA